MKECNCRGNLNANNQKLKCSNCGGINRMNKTDKSNGWVDEFDEAHLYTYSPHCTHLSEKLVKQFIQTQIDKAIREERNRFLEIIKSMEIEPNPHDVDDEIEIINGTLELVRTKLTKDK